MAWSRNIVVLCFACLAVVLGQKVDLTRTSDVSGTEVVNAVVGILRRTCLFPDSLLYLRRVAYVDSHDGKDADTYTTGYNGGIWRISEADFNMTITDPSLESYRNDIMTKLFIDWSRVTYSDLRKPLYSAVASELFAVLTAGTAGIPLTVETQSVLWSQNGARSPNVFVKAIYELENGSPIRQNLDVAFLLDSSASMSESDFNKAKEFVKSFISGLDVNSGLARVAVVEYSTVVYPIFGLNNNMNSTSLTESVSNITYKPGGTNTYEALKYVQDSVFKPQFGSRISAAKVVVIVTDGRSDDNVATINAAHELRASGVTIFAVGVGDLIDKRELSLVVSEPTCTHMQTVGNYSDLPSDSHNSLQLAVQAPVVLSPGNYSFSCSSDISAEVLMTSGGKTIEISTDDGELNVFGSGSTAFVPGSAIFGFNKTVTNTAPLNIYVPDGSQILLAMRNLSQNGCQSNYNIRILDGNLLRPGGQLVCVHGGLIGECTQTDLIGSPYFVIGTPEPVLSTICTGSDNYIASYPGKLDRYLSCSFGKLIVLYCPQGRVYSLIDMRCVDKTDVPTTVPTTTAATTPKPTTTTERLTAPPCIDGATAVYLGQSDRYLLCKSGKYAVVFCPPGYVFDVAVNTTQCVPIVVLTTPKPTVAATTAAATSAAATAAATTAAPVVVTNPPTNPPGIQTTFTNPCTPDHIAQGLFIFAYPPDVRKYIKCSIFPYTGTILDCGEHKYFSPAVGTCLFKDVLVNPTNETFVTDFPNPCIKNFPGDVQYHPYPGNPYKFIQCDAFGDAFVKDCDLGEIWKQEIYNCIPNGFKFDTVPPIVG